MKAIRPSTDEKAIPWAIFLAGCVVYVTNLNFASSGDTIYYANIIDNLRFDQLTAHQAYYLMGFLCKHMFGWAFGLPTDQALALMSALFGGGTLCVGYLLLKRYLESVRDALLGTLMLFLSHRFFFNAISAEIYIVQTFFIWVSFLLFETRRFYTAGLSIALAMWVSPLTIAFVLWFPMVAYLRGFGVRSLVRLCIPVALLYLPFLALFYEELLWGVRGVIVQDMNRQVDIVNFGYDIFRYQIKHYSFLNLLLIPAMFVTWREKRLLWISLAVVLPNIYIISQLRGEDHVFILPLDVFFSCWFVIGWRVLRDRSLVWLAATVIAAHSVVFILSERPFLTDSNVSYVDEMRAIGQLVENTSDSILFADWAQRMAFVYYNRHTTSYPLEAGIWYDMSYDLANLEKLKSQPGDFAGYDAVFVLETYSPSPQAKLFLDEASIKKRYEGMSKRRQLERFFNVRCQQVRSGIYVLYRCR